MSATIEPKPRVKKKITMNLWLDLQFELKKLSAGTIYESEYQVLLNDVLDEALKNKMLILKVLNKKEAELKSAEKAKK